MLVHRRQATFPSSETLAAEGLVLLATDEPYRVADLITADDVGREACGR